MCRTFKGSCEFGIWEIKLSAGRKLTKTKIALQLSKHQRESTVRSLSCQKMKTPWKSSSHDTNHMRLSHNPDLCPLEFHLWGYLNTRDGILCGRPFNTTHNLCDSIIGQVSEIGVGQCECLIGHFIERLDYDCTTMGSPWIVRTQIINIFVGNLTQRWSTAFL